MRISDWSSDVCSSDLATARAMTAFYQMLLAGGRLNGVRLLSPRMVEWVTRNHTGDRPDDNFGMPMHRGLGPHVRGTPPTIRGLGPIAGPRARSEERRVGQEGVRTGRSRGAPCN